MAAWAFFTGIQREGCRHGAGWGGERAIYPQGQPHVSGRKKKQAVSRRLMWERIKACVKKSRVVWKEERERAKGEWALPYALVVIFSKGTGMEDGGWGVGTGWGRRMSFHALGSNLDALAGLE